MFKFEKKNFQVQLWNVFFGFGTMKILVRVNFRSYVSVVRASRSVLVCLLQFNEANMILRGTTDDDTESVIWRSNAVQVAKGGWSRSNSDEYARSDLHEVFGFNHLGVLIQLLIEKVNIYHRPREGAFTQQWGQILEWNKNNYFSS